MAVRPVFVPSSIGHPLVTRMDIAFRWFPGMSVAQKRRSIASLHQAAVRILSIERILEISSKSEQEIGVALSAFNLSISMPGDGRVSVESAYQGSKVFEHGGPYTDIYSLTAREAKKDERLRNSGQLVGFRFFGRDWPLSPPTAFYDWLYINTLTRNTDLAEQIMQYSAFTDIEFNPERSINCQANSAAVYVALRRRGFIDDAVSSPDAFIAKAQATGLGSDSISLMHKPRLL